MRTHQYFHPLGPAPPAETKPTSAEEITYTLDDGTNVPAYLSTPVVDGAEAPTSCGVVIISDIFGYQSDETRTFADFLASHGLPTLIPDFYRGQPWPKKPIDDTFAKWLDIQPPARFHPDAKAAAAVMRERGFGTKIALIGFCFGGGRTMDEIGLAETGMNPAAAIAFYPTKFDFVKPAVTAACPLMVVAGDSDPLTPLSELKAMHAAIQEKNNVMPECEMIISEGAGHGFIHMGQADDDKADAEDILPKAVAFLKRHLQ